MGSFVPYEKMNMIGSDRKIFVQFVKNAPTPYDREWNKLLALNFL